VSETFIAMLTGGHPNSLGRTQEVVDLVLGDPARLDALFASMGSADPVVRMRVGDALEKVCRERPEWLVPRVERVLGELAAVDQPSVQWHVAQILDHVRGAVGPDPARRATDVLRRNLEHSTDWIVLNVTMDVLAGWAREDPALAAWLRPRLERLTGDPRRSVARRAAARLAELNGGAGP